MGTKKFMQTLDVAQFKQVNELAKKRGTNVQTMIRAIIIPEWTNEVTRQLPSYLPMTPRQSGKGLRNKRKVKKN